MTALSIFSLPVLVPMVTIPTSCIMEREGFYCHFTDVFKKLEIDILIYYYINMPIADVKSPLVAWLKDGLHRSWGRENDCCVSRTWTAHTFPPTWAFSQNTSGKQVWITEKLKKTWLCHESPIVLWGDRGLKTTHGGTPVWKRCVMLLTWIILHNLEFSVI